MAPTLLLPLVHLGLSGGFVFTSEVRGRAASCKYRATGLVPGNWRIRWERKRGVEQARPAIVGCQLSKDCAALL